MDNVYRPTDCTCGRPADWQAWPHDLDCPRRAALSGGNVMARAVADDQHAVPCALCGRPTFVPSGTCVRCWPVRDALREAAQRQRDAGHPAYQPVATYVHDCRKCLFLGQWPVVGMRAPVDWYQCGGSVIGRYDDAGHAYWSMPLSVLSRIDNRDPFAAAVRALYAARCDGACGSKGRAGEGCADPGHVS